MATIEQRFLKLVTPEAPDRDALEAARANDNRLRLAMLLRSTEIILDHARNRNWEAVERLERERQVELAACFGVIGRDDSPRVIEALATLLQMNRQITDLVAEARERLTGEQSLDVSRKRVARAYEEGC